MAWWTKKMIRKQEAGHDQKRAMPRHVALIMDGNGRWAERRGLPRRFGHQAGVEAMRRVIEAAGNLRLEVVTLYAFSTENWMRPRDEVDFLMKLPIEWIRRDLHTLMEKNVRLVVTGRLDEIPQETISWITKAVAETSANSGLTVNIALNYGGRAEITDAVRMIAEQVQRGELDPKTIDESTIGAYLYAPQLPDPDLIVRASGEQRLSNFLIWQGAYAELFFSPKLWPDFDEQELVTILDAYRLRDRRFGGLKNR